MRHQIHNPYFNFFECLSGRPDTRLRHMRKLEGFMLSLITLITSDSFRPVISNMASNETSSSHAISIISLIVSVIVSM